MSDTTTNPREPQSPEQKARQSYNGSKLTESQFDKAWQLSGIIDREIQRSGSFREPLTDCAHAFARTEKIDAVQAEAAIRDVYAARYDRTMNQNREALIEREAQLEKAGPDRALSHARAIEGRISGETTGQTEPFYQAYDREAVRFARDAQITETGAKRMMKESYQQVEQRDLYETGKALEEQHHRPRMEAEREVRQATRETAPERRQSYRRS